MDSMTCEQWTELKEWDEIEPIGHGVRMLGHIAKQTESFFGGNASAELMCRAFTPWLEPGAVVASKPEEVEAMWSGMGL